MIPRYCAATLHTSIHTIEQPSDTKKNIERILPVIDLAYHNCWEYPLKLVTLCEQAIQGFPDTRRDLSHVETARKLMCTTVPGEETDQLGEKASQLGIYIVANLRAIEPEFPDRYWNIAFIVSPQGKVVHKYHKLQLWPGEPTVTPHDLWDKWIEVHGKTLDAFFPVADTEIGRLGTLICNDGSYPETFRGLAFNGAEVICHASYPTRGGHDHWYNIQDQSAALSNSCYVIGAQASAQYNVFSGVDFSTGQGGLPAHIYDYRGTLIASRPAVSDSWCVGVIDIAALRSYRNTAAWGNFLKDLRTEIYQMMYEKPIFPKNLYSENPPPNKQARVQLFKKQIEVMRKRNIWAEMPKEEQETSKENLVAEGGPL